MLLPLEGNFEQAERFYAQAEADLPTKKRVWREIVRAKLRAQGRVLAHLGRDEAGLSALAGRVRSGDAGNLESTGALRYWPRVFGDAKFRRGNDDDPRNALLNYGYAVLRATSARAICGVGLHPTFGVHHQNRYNAFALADDLMEPLRPLVDLRVARFLQFLEGGEVMLNKTSKAAILSALTLRYSAEGESRTLFDLQARVAYSLAAVLTKKEKKFRYPDLELDRANE
jgi:CRISPR-associated protein Cas1